MGDVRDNEAYEEELLDYEEEDEKVLDSGNKVNGDAVKKLVSFSSICNSWLPLVSSKSIISRNMRLSSIILFSYCIFYLWAEVTWGYTVLDSETSFWNLSFSELLLTLVLNIHPKASVPFTPALCFWAYILTCFIWWALYFWLLVVQIESSH